MVRLFAFLASLLTSLGGLALASPAAAEEMSLSVPVTGMGNWEFQGPVDVTDGKFEEYFNSGNARLQIWGRIEGDRVTIGGHIKVTGLYEQGSGFNIEGSFKGDKFVGTFIEPLNYGKSHRGQITLTRPAAQAAAAPDAAAAPQASPPPVAAAPTETATVVAPPPPAAATAESLEPKLSAAQRQAVQRQLTILGFYDRAIDGSFGAGTRAAIGRFQLANAFDATGYLDATSMRLLKDLSKAREKEIAAAAARQQAEQQAAAEQDAAAAQKLADEQAAQEQAAAERKAADEQARLEAAKLEAERQALEAQKADLKRQQEALAKAQQESAATPDPAAPAATPPPATTTAAAPAVSGDFASVIATLQPIDEVYIAIKPAKIRSAPSVAAARLGTLNVGDRIEVMGRLPGQDWYLVARDEQPIGYVVINQLAAESDATRATSTAAADPAPAATQTAALPPEFANLDFGRYHALVIGNDRYRSLPQLETAVGDAEAVAELLDRNYHFDVRLLTNATEEDIIGALTQMRRELEFGDNLLIYYAGHGWQDKDTQEGYWLPIDAAEDNQSNWVSNADITTALKALKAKHIIIVADSCYSGSLTRSANISLRGIDYIERIVKKKARTVLTSGGEEPVLDSGGGGHSVFARAFLTALEENDGVIDGQELFRRLRDSVVANAPQTPEYGDIRGAGHDGGDFLFVRR